MKKRPNKPLSMRIAAVLTELLMLLGAAMPTAAVGSPHQAQMSLLEIDEAVDTVRSGATVDAKAGAARRLAVLANTIRSGHPRRVLVSDLIALMNPHEEDPVLFWVATALGNVGRPARAAIPALRRIYPKVACHNGAITAAGGIRYALVKLGAGLPEKFDCPNMEAG